MKLKYPIAIEHGNNTTAFGVIVPDLPGCFSAGDTLNEAIKNSREAINLWIESALDNGNTAPDPGTVAIHSKNPEYTGFEWAVVEIDASQTHNVISCRKEKTMEDKEENSIAQTMADRLRQVIVASDNKRLSRVNMVKAKTGRTDLPLEERKLTQQEAAAYCGVSTATIHRWIKDGLKTTPYGQRKRFFAKDLQDFMKNK